MSIDGEQLVAVFRSMTEKDRPWALGEFSRRRGHGCYEIPERHENVIDLSVNLYCSECGWSWLTTLETVEQGIDWILSLGPEP